MLQRSSIPILLLFLIGLSASIYFRVPSDQFQESKPKLVPPKSLNHTSFGFKIAISDSLWLRTLQNDDFCEVDRPKARFNTAILLEDALSNKLEPSRCDRGWVYQMLDLVTDLNPFFGFAFRTGGVLLSVVVDDREGARLFFEKGIQHFPNDWKLLYAAAYHYIFELQNAERAEEILAMGSKVPNAPAIITILAARIQSVQGREQLAIETLTDFLKTAKPGTEGYLHAEGRLNTIREALARKNKKK